LPAGVPGEWNFECQSGRTTPGQTVSRGADGKASSRRKWIRRAIPRLMRCSSTPALLAPLFGVQLFFRSNPGVFADARPPAMGWHP